MNILKAVDVLDRAVPHYLDFTQEYEERVDWVDRAFYGQSDDDRQRLKEHWRSKDYRFDEFYLNLDEHNQRAMLEFFGIAVEAEPYPDAADRIQAELNGASPWDCHPFETYTLLVFLRFAYNNSLDRLATLEGGPAALLQSGVERHGNGKNWGMFYRFVQGQEQDELRQALVKAVLESE